MSVCLFVCLSVNLQFIELLTQLKSVVEVSARCPVGSGRHAKRLFLSGNLILAKNVRTIYFEKFPKICVLGVNTRAFHA